MSLFVLVSLKVYFNEGNCVRIRIKDEELDEIAEMVKRITAVTSGIKVSGSNIKYYPNITLIVVRNATVVYGGTAFMGFTKTPSVILTRYSH